MSYSLEQMFEVWDDKSGERFEIGLDRDATEITEIRYRDELGKIGNRIRIPDEALPLVIDALERRLAEIITKKGGG